MAPRARSRPPPCSGGLVARAHRRGVRCVRGRRGAQRRGRTRRPGARSPTALPWLRRLHHETLRPPRAVALPHRPIPGPACSCRAALEDEPPRLAERWSAVAAAAVDAYRAAWRRADPAPAARAVRLARDRGAAAPGHRPAAAAIVWDPDAPAASTGCAARSLQRRTASPSSAIHARSRRWSRGTRARFLAAVVEPAALPPPQPNTFQTRLHLPARDAPARRLQPARAGHGAPRTVRRCRTRAPWSGRARRTSGRISPTRRAGCRARVARRVLGRAARRAGGGARRRRSPRAPAAVRRLTAADLGAARRERAPAGVALGRLTLTRMPDYRANLVARALHERRRGRRRTCGTTSARCAPSTRRRSCGGMLIRYLFEYQYLRPGARADRVADPRASSSRARGSPTTSSPPASLDETRFDALAPRSARLCACHAVDPAALRLPPRPRMTGRAGPDSMRPCAWPPSTSGTNSVHMVIANVTPDGRIEVIDRVKEMVRLGRRAFTDRAAVRRDA